MTPDRKAQIIVAFIYLAIMALLYLVATTGVCG